jgi:23S rRNA pseudouridine1911/1915/1917 synthase
MNPPPFPTGPQDNAPIEFVVPAEAAGARLDRVLADAVPGLSRSRLQGLIKAGAVTAADATVDDPGRKVKPGERYKIVVPEPESPEPLAEDIPLSVVYEDDDIVIVDKPAGLVVHPAAGHQAGTLVNALIAHCGESLSGIGGVKRPGIVHRLDKDTSGLLVVAKNDRAHQALSGQFQAHGSDGCMERRYLALVWGQPLRQHGTIDAPLGRSRTSRTKIVVTSGPLGRRAVTHFEVLERFAGADGKPLASLVALVLETGRTHQIRVHMAHAGHPVMGDPVYATGFRTSAARLGPDSRAALASLDRQALHAAFLRVQHPVTAEPVEAESRLPADMAALVGHLRREHGGNSGPSPKKRRI